MADPRTGRNRAWLKFILAWLVFVVCFIGVFAAYQRHLLFAELRSEVSNLHRVASQRADQHDAHLTSLSALATASGSDDPELFLELAATIERFYPRIVAIDLVPLNNVPGYVSSREGRSDEVLHAIRDAALASEGQLMLLGGIVPDGHYLLVKRSPNSVAARFGLSLEVNASALLETESEFWSESYSALSLRMPGGEILIEGGRHGDGDSGTQFEKALGSFSQPLILQAGAAPELADLLPPGRSLLATLVASFLYLFGVFAYRQVARARTAETQAKLSAQEARLAHASRVNALGEMASGMAHELTQPLTAILSQAQAGRHIAARRDNQDVQPILDSIVEQAKRASLLLERLRSWSRPQPHAAEQASVKEAIGNVVMLLRQETEQAGVRIKADVESGLPVTDGDQVELEQIIFNLVRNAIDAVSDAPRPEVSIMAHHVEDQLIVEVSDTGPGIPGDIKQRLFDPFVTGKEEGTGLGLALCERLAERMGGEISYLEDRAETVFQLRLPVASSPQKEAAE